MKTKYNKERGRVEPNLVHLNEPTLLRQSIPWYPLRSTGIQDKSIGKNFIQKNTGKVPKKHENVITNLMQTCLPLVMISPIP